MIGPLKFVFVLLGPKNKVASHAEEDTSQDENTKIFHATAPGTALSRRIMPLTGFRLQPFPKSK